MTDRYENIRKALEAIQQASAKGHRHKLELAHLDFREACEPDTLRALLAERDALAAALESAREDAERLDALEALVNEQPDKAVLLHHGLHIIRSDERRYAGWV